MPDKQQGERVPTLEEFAVRMDMPEGADAVYALLDAMRESGRITNWWFEEEKVELEPSGLFGGGAHRVRGTVAALETNDPAVFGMVINIATKAGGLFKLTEQSSHGNSGRVHLTFHLSSYDGDDEHNLLVKIN